MVAYPPVNAPQPQTFRVKIRIDTVRLHLSSADGTDYSEGQVLQWLADAGFRQAGDQWLVEEGNLGHLDPSEVSEITPS